METEKSSSLVKSESYSCLFVEEQLVQVDAKDNGRNGNGLVMGC